MIEKGARQTKMAQSAYSKNSKNEFLKAKRKEDMTPFEKQQVVESFVEILYKWNLTSIVS